jgi:hypothetical protein
MPEQSDVGHSEQLGSSAGADDNQSANAAIHFSDAPDTIESTVIPNSVLDDYRLGPETRLLYVILRRLATTGRGRAIGQSELGRHVGIPAHRIPRHLSLLQRSGLIHIEGELSTRIPNRYWIMGPAMLGERPPRTAAIAAQSRTQGTASSAGRSLLQRLIAMGVDPQIAGPLVATYPRERVAGAIRAAHRRHPRPRDPAAWIVAAVRQGWVAQDAAIAARRRQESHERAIVARERRADAALSALPVETQQSLRQQAAEVVKKTFGDHLATTTIGSMLITAELRRMVAGQAGIPQPDAIPPPG